MNENEWTQGDTLYHRVTLDDLADPDFREAIESAIESWLPNYMVNDRVSSYDDLLERLEGPFRLPDGRWVNLDLGDSYDSPVWKKLKSIARSVARQVG